MTKQNEAEQFFASARVLRTETDSQARAIAASIAIRLSIQAEDPSIRQRSRTMLNEQYGADVVDQARVLANAAS